MKTWECGIRKGTKEREEEEGGRVGGGGGEKKQGCKRVIMETMKQNSSFIGTFIKRAKEVGISWIGSSLQEELMFVLAFVTERARSMCPVLACNLTLGHLSCSGICRRRLFPRFSVSWCPFLRLRFLFCSTCFTVFGQCWIGDSLESPVFIRVSEWTTFTFRAIATNPE